MFGGQGRRVTHFALHRHQREAHARLVASPAAQDFREPVLGAWRYGAQGAAIDPGLRKRVDDLLARAAEHDWLRPPSVATRTSSTWSRPRD